MTKIMETDKNSARQIQPCFRPFEAHSDEGCRARALGCKGKGLHKLLHSQKWKLSKDFDIWLKEIFCT